MKKDNNQRQEMLFLALAVAVLVGVVVLLLVLRSNRRPSETNPESAPPAKTVEKPAPSQSAQPSPSRDPFVSKKEADAPAHTTSKKDSLPADQEDAPTEMKLVGIMRGGTPLAIIHDQEARHYVKLGARVGAYTLTSISRGQVVLTKKGGDSVTLKLNASR